MAGAAGRPRRSPGRPATIDRDAIANVVAGMTVEQVSMRAVAGALGISVPGLYHWVRGRDELLRLAAEQAARRVVPPRDTGQHWAVWLLQWAEHARRGFLADPGLLRQFTQGTLGLERMLEVMDVALDLLVRSGFTEQEALTAFHLVSELAIGAATADIREQRMQSEAHGTDREYRRILARHDAGELPHIRRLAEAGGTFRHDFPGAVRTVVAGLAVQRGEDWQDVVTLLDAHLATTGDTDREAAP